MSDVLSVEAQQFMRSVGNTPLVKIGPSLYGKLETANPTGSVKDRMISFVVAQAISRGEIKPTTLLVEATSGNTGIALAALGAAMGNPVQIIMPGNMSEERKQMMKTYGAKIIEAPDDDFVGAIAMRDQYLKANENAWSPMQFSNPENVECHFKTTAKEIYSQLSERGEEW